MTEAASSSEAAEMSSISLREELSLLNSLHHSTGPDGQMDGGGVVDDDDDEREPQPVPEELQEELMKAKEAYLYSRIHGSVKGAIATGHMKELDEEPVQSSDHLTKVFETAEADIQKLVDSYLQEDARHSAAHAELLKKKAEVEELLQALDEAQVRLARELEKPSSGEGEQGGGEESQLQRALRATQEEGDAVNRRVALLEAKLAEMRTTEGQIDASEKDADGASPVDEQRIKMEMAKMRERGDWLGALLETLQDLYSVQVEIIEATEDAAGEKTLMMKVVYPSQHSLMMKLASSPFIKILDAKLQSPPSQRKAEEVKIDDMLQMASTLVPPEDIMFTVREVGWMIGSREVARQEIRDLMKKFIVKSNETKEEFVVTITFAEGVVASISLLPGYPQMPGSLRITSLVGVGGWRDSELAVTSRSLNRLGGLDSLPAMVETLHQRIGELDSK